MTALLPDIPAVEIQVVEMTNRARAEQKLAPVKPDAKLSAAARAYAAYLANTNAFSHTADGRQSGDRITASGYRWCQVGENLASAQSSNGFASRDLAAKAVEGWLNSPGHRKNLLARDVTDIGVGTARVPADSPKYVTVQLFARPQSLSYEFQISNATKTTVSYSFGGKTHEVKPTFAITHSSCMPSALEFPSLGKSFEAKDGIVYTLSPGPAGVTVDAKPKVKLRY